MTIYHGVTFIDISTDNDKAILIRQCDMCKRRTVIAVDRLALIAWENGRLIQDVWPEISADIREVLMTGFDPRCWESLFPDLEMGND